MQRSAFQLARRVAERPRATWPVFCWGVAAGLLVPLLVLELGWIVQLLVARNGGGSPPEVPLQWFRTAVERGWISADHTSQLISLVVLGWLITLLQAAALFAVRRAAHANSLAIASDLRRKIYRQGFRLGPYDLLGATRTRPEELFSEKVEVIRRGMAAWWTAIPQAVVALLLLLSLAALVSGWLTLLAVLLAACVLRAYHAVRRLEYSHHQHWLAEVQTQDRVLRDELHLAPLLKGYSLIEPPVTAFENALRDQSRAELQLVRKEYLLRPLLWTGALLAGGLLALVIGLGTGPSVAGVVLLCGALLTAYYPYSHLSRLSGIQREMSAAADDIQVFLDREPSVVQLPDAMPMERLSREITLERVNLADRHGRHLLEEVTWHIPAGCRVALMATDPQTPPAVAGLLVRFYDPTAGRVLFDDHDIRRATLDTIRGQTALVFKDGLLFHDTLLKNITCGDSGFTTMQVSDVSKRARIAELIRDYPEGLATTIGLERPPLRLDQAFRIGLARALLRSPSVLIVEEPPGGEEAIDRELDEALAQAGESRTLIVLSARISTLRNADLVCVVHEGKLLVQGKHAELLQVSELYRHLCYVRFNPFRTSVQ